MGERKIRQVNISVAIVYDHIIIKCAGSGGDRAEINSVLRNIYGIN